MGPGAEFWWHLRVDEGDGEDDDKMINHLKTGISYPFPDSNVHSLLGYKTFDSRLIRF